MNKLYQELADILEVDSVEPNQTLEEFETWDSLAALSLVVSVRANFGVTIDSADLRRAKTIKDLEQLVRLKSESKNSH